MEKSPQRRGRDITLKAVTIGALVIILLIPTFLIRALVNDRASTSRNVVEQIAAQWSHPQMLYGPVLNVPYTTEHTNSEGKQVTRSHILTITPATLGIEARLEPEVRKRSIYKAIVYKSQIDMQGTFSLPSLTDYADAKFDWAKVVVSFSVTDLRGIAGQISFSLAGVERTLAVSASNDMIVSENAREIVLYSKIDGYSRATYEQSYLSASAYDVLESLRAGDTIPFSCALSLNGSSSINFVPVGGVTDVTVSGQWPSPSFIGNFLPDEREVTPDSFSAHWNVLSYNRNIPAVSSSDDDLLLGNTAFGVSLLETVGHYQQNERAAKYALMFILLTFVVFFFVEILNRRRIHLMQYLLVAASLLVFYILLLSLSEQIGFDWAYIIAAVSTIAMVGLYSISIFKSGKLSVMLTGLLALLYLYLYIVLQLEDLAILIGSIGLFVVLAIIMYASRKVNWYEQ
jgi:inner membrane protein